MRQQQIQDAVKAYLSDGDIGPWMQILDAVRDGQVIVEASKTRLTFSAFNHPRRSAFAARLNALREEAGMTHQQVADAVEVSLSSVIRNMRGLALTQWPVMMMMIQAMGGDPESFRVDYSLARDEPLSEGSTPRKTRLNP